MKDSDWLRKHKTLLIKKAKMEEERRLLNKELRRTRESMRELDKQLLEGTVHN